MADEQDTTAQQPVADSDTADQPDRADITDPRNWPTPSSLPRGYHLACLAHHAQQADLGQDALEDCSTIERVNDPDMIVVYQQQAHDRQMALVHGLAALNQAVDYTNHLLEHLCNADYPQAGSRPAAPAQWRFDQHTGGQPS